MPLLLETVQNQFHHLQGQHHLQQDKTDRLLEELATLKNTSMEGIILDQMDSWKHNEKADNYIYVFLASILFPFSVFLYRDIQVKATFNSPAAKFTAFFYLARLEVVSVTAIVVYIECRDIQA